MLRLVLIGSILLIAVIIAFAAGPKVTPLGTPASSPDTLRVAGPPTAVDSPSRRTTRPFIYDPCLTMTWVTRHGVCKAKVSESE